MSTRSHIYSMESALKLLSRYEIATDRDQFLADLGDAHAHQKWEALGKIAMCLNVIFPEEIQTVTNNFAERRNLINGHGNVYHNQLDGRMIMPCAMDKGEEYSFAIMVINWEAPFVEALAHSVYISTLTEVLTLETKYPFIYLNEIADTYTYPQSEAENLSGAVGDNADRYAWSREIYPLSTLSQINDTRYIKVTPNHENWTLSQIEIEAQTSDGVVFTSVAELTLEALMYHFKITRLNVTGL